MCGPFKLLVPREQMRKSRFFEDQTKADTKRLFQSESNSKDGSLFQTFEVQVKSVRVGILTEQYLTSRCNGTGKAKKTLAGALQGIVCCHCRLVPFAAFTFLLHMSPATKQFQMFPAETIAEARALLRDKILHFLA